MKTLNRDLFRPQRKRQWISSALVVVLVLSLGSVAFASTIEREPSRPPIAEVLRAATTEFTKDATRLIERVRDILANIRLPEIFAIELDWPSPLVASRPNDRGAAQLAATLAVVPASPVEAPTLSQSATTTTIIYQTVNQPVVERIVQSPVEVAPLQTGVSEASLTTRLQELASAVNQRIQNAFIGAARSAVVQNVSDITVSGVSGLTDADIPDDLTASNYLALTGGALTGTLSGTNLTLSGDLTVSGAQTLSGAITIPYLSATSTTASSFIQASTTRLSVFDTAYFGGTATSTFDAAGNLSITGTLGVTGKTTLGYASTTGITADYASTSALIASNSFTLAKLTGFLKATAGAVATALVDLANDVTGILPVGNGGTGWAAFESGAIPYGNGTGQLATTTTATAGYVLAYLNGVPTWTATTTLANISGTLGVGNGGTGATSFGQGWLYSDGGTTVLAASTSPTVNYITATSTSATSTFAGGIIGPNSFVVQQTSGNVGIGTTSPAAPLDVYSGTADVAAIFDSSDNIVDIKLRDPGGDAWVSGYLGNLALQRAGGNVGIGTASPGDVLDVYATAGGIRITDSNSTGVSANPSLSFYDQTGTLTGWVGDGSTSVADIYLSSASGVIRIQGTGGVCTMTGAASGGTCFSDERLKNVTGTVTGVLDGLSTLSLVTFYWNDRAHSATNASTTIEQTGFVAQAVEQVFPELVHSDESGYKTLDYSTLSMYGLAATGELNLNLQTIASTTPSSTPQSQSFAASFFNNLFARITTWLADAGNGITEFFADHVIGRQGTFEQLCIGSTCVTEVELKALLDREPVTNFSAPAPASLPRETSTRELPGDASEEAAVVADVPELTDVPSIIPDDLNGEDVAQEDSAQPQNADAVEHSSDGPQAEAVDSPITESASATADAHGEPTERETVIEGSLAE